MSESLPAEPDSRRRLCALEACLRALLDAFPEGAVQVDAEGRVVAWNQRFADLFGREAAQLHGAVFVELSASRPQLQLDFRPLPPPAEGALVVVKTAPESDKTERKRLEGAKKQESLGVLAGGFAHHFNNLLTGIIGYTSLARRQLPAGAPVGELLDQAAEASQRAAELCRQILAYSGRGRFVVGPLDLSQVVNDARGQLEASVSPSVALVLRPAQDLPPITADASQVRQALFNLLINASESVGDRAGVVTVQTGRVWCDRATLQGAVLGDDLPEGEYVFLEVADDGAGMDIATRERLFEPFFSTKFTGRGLGLAAVHGTLRGHHGAIQLTTEPGVGTTIRLLFPRAPESVSAPAPPTAPAGVVLFVDDEPALRGLAVAMLRHAHYEVLTAGDGAEALEVFRARAADVRVVILDLTMPGLTADETVRELRRLRPDVPVILSSGHSEQDVRQRVDAGGLAGFLQKPYVPRELIEKVRELGA